MGLELRRPLIGAEGSSLVEEALSVSGVLLGKTMGRAPDLADRFTEESRTLADLEVRQRMAGRWVMASIQATFAIMPALVYWFAGWSFAHGNDTITIGTVVAFTTLQTRLFFPIGQLLSVGVDVQTSLALFERIFEYLDLDVDIDEKPVALTLGCAGEPLPVSFENVSFKYDKDGDWTLRDITIDAPAGSKTAL